MMTFVNEPADMPRRVFSLGMAIHVVCQNCGSHLGVQGHPNGNTYLRDIDPEIQQTIPDKGKSDSYGNFMGICLAVAPCKSCIEKETGPARELKLVLAKMINGDA